eukprot:851522-Pyramimonas_sp.AAC.1
MTRGIALPMQEVDAALRRWCPNRSAAERRAQYIRSGVRRRAQPWGRGTHPLAALSKPAAAASAPSQAPGNGDRER